MSSDVTYSDQNHNNWRFPTNPTFTSRVIRMMRIALRLEKAERGLSFASPYIEFIASPGSNQPMVNYLFGLLVWNLDDILEVTRVKKDPGISDQEPEPQCIKGWIPQAIFTTTAAASGPTRWWWGPYPETIEPAVQSMLASMLHPLKQSKNVLRENFHNTRRSLYSDLPQAGAHDENIQPSPGPLFTEEILQATRSCTKNKLQQEKESVKIKHRLDC